jgi:hypothetical protein
MKKLKLAHITGLDDRLVFEFELFSIIMAKNHVLDGRPRISPGENQRNLTNLSVKNDSRTLDQVVRPDRKLVDVLVLEELAGVLSLWRIVEKAMGIQPAITSLQLYVPENILGIFVVVLPDERDLRPILPREGIMSDGPAVGALEVGLSSPTLEVRFHRCPSFQESV